MARQATRTLHRGDGGGGLVRHTVLPGGLRIVTEAVPTVRSVTVGVWVGVGSRDEAPSLAGASHYLEHLLFKGTRRRDALDISAAIDAVGGEMNAFTSKEYTCFYARVLDTDLPLAVDVVGDLVTSSVIRAADVESERGVILEEIAMHEDDPTDMVHDQFAQVLFGDGPLARPVLGSVESIETIGRAADRRLLPAPLPPAGHGRRGRRQRRPRHRRAPGQEGVRRRRACSTATRRPPARALGGRARSRHRRRARASAVRPSRPTSCSAAPASRRTRRASVRARRAQRRPRRRHVVAAVPGGPGEARAGLLGLQLSRAVRRHRTVRRLRGLRAAQGRRRAGHLPRRGGEGRRPTASPPRSSSAARASCAARWCSGSRTPARG